MRRGALMSGDASLNERGCTLRRCRIGVMFSETSKAN